MIVWRKAGLFDRVFTSKLTVTYLNVKQQRFYKKSHQPLNAHVQGRLRRGASLR
jgi:hypothetical protein